MEAEKILEEKYTNSVRKKYVTVNGFTLTQRYEEKKDEIDNFEVNEDDIWVCSFPKSGTTWLQEMVWMIINDLDFERGKESLDKRSPFLEISAINDVSDRSDLNIPLHFRDSISFAKCQKRPRLIKTHLPFSLLPHQIKNNIKKPKIVYITREPKDACVSYYHHAKLMSGFQGDFDQVCELFLSGKNLYGPYWNHVLSYWEMRNSPNVLFLRYEDMKKDLGNSIKKVAEFLQHSLDDEKIKILSEHLSFESMKKNSSVNREDVVDIFQKVTHSNFDGKFMRRGKVGDYNNFMSEDCVKRFDEWTELNTKNTDYVL